jgi:hypothetical protein
MRQLSVGFLVGALFGACVVLFFLRPSTLPAPSSRASTRMEVVEPNDDGRIREDRSRASSPAPGTTAHTSGCPVAEPTQEACIARFNASARREREARNAEGVDAVWAPAMTQRLRSFLANTDDAKQFQVTKIDCRSTFCEIEAIGTAEASILAFQRLTTAFAKDSGMMSSEHLSQMDGEARMMQLFKRP